MKVRLDYAHNPPTYVYASKFHPLSDFRVVVTGAFDGALRVFDCRQDAPAGRTKKKGGKGVSYVCCAVFPRGIRRKLVRN